MQGVIKKQNLDNQVSALDLALISYDKPNHIKNPLCENCSCVSNNIFEACQQEMPHSITGEQLKPTPYEQQAGWEMKPVSRIIPFQVGKEERDTPITRESTDPIFFNRQTPEEGRSVSIVNEYNPSWHDREKSSAGRLDLIALSRKLLGLDIKPASELYPGLKFSLSEPGNTWGKVLSVLPTLNDQSQLEITSSSIVSDLNPGIIMEISTAGGLSTPPVCNTQSRWEVESDMESVPGGTIVFEPCLNQTVQKNTGTSEHPPVLNRQPGLEVQMDNGIEDRIRALEEKILRLESEILRLDKETENFKNRGIIKLNGSMISNCGCGIGT